METSKGRGTDACSNVTVHRTARPAGWGQSLVEEAAESGTKPYVPGAGLMNVYFFTLPAFNQTLEEHLSHGQKFPELQ